MYSNIDSLSAKTLDINWLPVTEFNVTYEHRAI